MVEAGLCLAGCALLAVAVTWPLVLDLTTEVSGPGSGGDRSGYAWDVWFNREHGFSVWGTSEQDIVSAPFGREVPASINLLQIVFLGPAWLISLAAGPIAGLNGSLLLGLTLGPAAIYLLVRWIGVGVAVAAWAAIAFALAPDAILRASGHYPLAVLASVPLLLLAAWRWLERPAAGRAFWLAAGSALCWLTSPYWGVMSLVVVAVAAIAGAIAVARRSALAVAARRVGELAAAAGVLVAVPLTVVFLTTRDTVEAGFTRSRSDLALHGAHLSDYVVPDGGLPVRDVFGSGWLGVDAPGRDRGNFLGYGTIALALVGAVLAYRHRRGLPRRARVVLLTALPIVAAVAWFSLATPTRWLGVTIPTPSDALYDALPFLRVYARFGVVVTAVAICVAAVGLHLALRGRRPVVSTAAIAGAMALTLFEFPPAGSLPIGSSPPVTVAGRAPDQVPTWAWLADNEPDALVFEMPGRANEAIERYYMYGQLTHGHRILNGNLFPGQLGYDVVNQVGLSSWPNSAPWLRAIGIDLVTINPWAYAMAGLPAPDPADPPAGYRAVTVFPDGSAVWRVSAQPADAVPVFRREGWAASEFRPDGGIWRWMDDEGHMTIVAAEPGATYDMSFRARPLDPSRAHPLSITLPDGSVRRVVVQGEEQVVRLRVRMPEAQGDLVIRNQGPPARPITPADPRVGSVMVSEPVLSLASAPSR